jgi:hypothetical protein
LLAVFLAPLLCKEGLGEVIYSMAFSCLDSFFLNAAGSPSQGGKLDFIIQTLETGGRLLGKQWQRHKGAEEQSKKKWRMVKKTEYPDLLPLRRGGREGFM